MTRKFFMDEHQNEVKAFESIAELKQYISKSGITADYDICSGLLNGKRYYGCGGYGIRIDDITALDNIDEWWETEWDTEVNEL